MNCRAFESAWNDRLDHPGRPVVDAPALEAHEAACDGCRALAAGYRVLLQVLAEPPPPIGVPEGFADRVLAAAAPGPRVLGGSLARRYLLPLAAAAAIVGALVLSARGPVAPPAPGVAGPEVAVRAVDPDELAEALADVGSASLALAREASAPAARLGSEAIGAAGFTDGVGTLGLAVPGVAGNSPSLLEGVGGRVSASARPLAGTARSAFGFLAVAPEG